MLKHDVERLKELQTEMGTMMPRMIDLLVEAVLIANRILPVLQDQHPDQCVELVKDIKALETLLEHIGATTH